MNKMITLFAAAISVACSASADTATWNVTDHVDPIDDTIMKMAQSQSGPYAVLAVSCREERMFVYLKASLLDMDFHNTRMVAWRVDDEPSVQEPWVNSKKGGSGLAHEQAVSFAQAVASGDERLVIRSGGETVVFPLSGSDPALEEVLEFCGI